MRTARDYEIVQNTALGALLLWVFSSEYYRRSGGCEGPDLSRLVLVLPMLYHRRTLESIRSRVFEGGLFRALADDRTLVAGLQDRMQAMADQTFESLGMALAAGLLTFDSQTARVNPNRLTAPELASEESRDMIAAARRLGVWFEELSLDQLMVVLKVRF